jgi:uncharacterized membrane protein
MLWLLLSLLSAMALATADAVTKRFFGDLNPFEMGLARTLFGAPWLLASLFFIPWERPDGVFYLCIAAGLPLEVLALYCYMKAIKIAPLSLTLPFLAFTPAFMIFTGWSFLGELPSAGGLAGIAVIVAGAYCLNLSAAGAGYLSPLRAIFNEHGSLLMLLVALIYAHTSVIGKLAVLHANPFMFGAVYFNLFALLLVCAAPLSRSTRARSILDRPLAGVLLGGLSAVMIYSHFAAIARIDAAYMIAVKRTSLLFGVLYGGLWFKEEHIKERLLGAALMLAGVVLIAWLG